MMVNPNIYHAIVFDLHQKVREFLDQLDQTGQIDHDETRAPHVISVDNPNSSVFRCMFLRNGRPEHFLIHTRRKAEPIRSWTEDGWKRPAPVETPPEHGNRKERERRQNESRVLPLDRALESIVEQILR